MQLGGKLDTAWFITKPRSCFVTHPTLSTLPCHIHTNNALSITPIYTYQPSPPRRETSSQRMRTRLATITWETSWGRGSSPVSSRAGECGMIYLLCVEEYAFSLRGWGVFWLQLVHCKALILLYYLLYSHNTTITHHTNNDFFLSHILHI